MSVKLSTPINLPLPADDDPMFVGGGRPLTFPVIWFNDVDDDAADDVAEDDVVTDPAVPAAEIIVPCLEAVGIAAVLGAGDSGASIPGSVIHNLLGGRKSQLAICFHLHTPRHSLPTDESGGGYLLSSYRYQTNLPVRFRSYHLGYRVCQCRSSRVHGENGKRIFPFNLPSCR